MRPVTDEDAVLARCAAVLDDRVAAMHATEANDSNAQPDEVDSEILSVDDVLEILSVKLLGVVPEDEEIIVSTNKGEPVSGTDNVRSGLAYRNIARRIRGEDVPIMDLEVKNPSWMTKIASFFNPAIRV